MTFEYRGLRYGTHTEVYVPHDDTWLLVDAVRDVDGVGKGDIVVETGCGAGLGLIAATGRGARGIGIDRNPAALRLARDNARLNEVSDRVDVVLGDLVAPVDLDRVDWLLFNPPYLPTAREERLPGALNLAFDGGPTGNETLFRFVSMLEAHAARGKHRPALLLVTSSLNDRGRIKTRLAAAGWDEVEPLGSAAFPFERLYAEAFRGGSTTAS
ncbi:MAG: methyltransferase [Euryarchaeota archaeon]|nr:methyltransferase [Euryarchaeota archaeon]